MDYLIKIVGCAVLALLCIAIPMLTVLSIVYQWSVFLAFCLIVVSFVIAVTIFIALMDVE